MAKQFSLVVDRNVPVPMRDGTTLCADVYRPASTGRYPTLLQRTPYDKEWLATKIQLLLRATAAGYAVVSQDVRGRFASAGEFHPYVNERLDGYDTLEWLVDQPWCNGRVGMFNQSYTGLTQWQAALTGHPALQAIVPGVTADNFHDGWAYQGGAFQLSFSLSWTLTNLMPNSIKRQMAVDDTASADYQTLLDVMHRMPDEFSDLSPAARMLIDTYAPFYHEWTRHVTYDDYWERLDVSRGHEEMTVSALNLGGWYDIFQKGTIGNYTGMRAHPDPAVRERQHLLIGPWNHGGMRAGNPIGEVDFGPRSTGAEIDIDGIHLRWYDHWLRDIDNGVDSEPPVRIFVMGTNRWRFEHEWPLHRTDWQNWHFHSGGCANGANGDGILSRDRASNEPPDAFIYNPSNPTLSQGGPLCCNPVHSLGGAFDQREVEQRSDVLVYTSAPLDEPLEVTGPVKVILYASTSAPDTDFTAKLVDVAPCGYARNLCSGMIRARYRNSMIEEALLTPGDVYQFEIDLIATSNEFQRGHCIRVEIASADFPRFDRNPNTGERPGTSTAMVKAFQTVFHSAEFPSRVVLPVIPRVGAAVNAR